MKVCKIIFACLVASITISQLHAETFYRWTDEKGIVHYSPLKPRGVEYETFDTNFSHAQRKLIEENKKARAEYDLIHNRDELLAKEEERRKQIKMRLETCVDSTYDKLSYQIRRIDNNATKAKNQCETQFNKDNENDSYINCVKKAEQERQEKLMLLESGINYCITDDTPPEIIYDVIKKYRDKLNITIDKAKDSNDSNDSKDDEANKKKLKGKDKKNVKKDKNTKKDKNVKKNNK
jgi:hypothetical protein